MPITPDRLSRLREFGLSEYAARAYLALLDLGVAEARDVSTLSKVPQAKIYHVLEQLHEKGLAVVLPEFPKKYAPVPFPEYLDRLHEEHERAAQSIERDREILAEMFRVMGDTEVGNRGFFTVIRGRRNVLTKIQEMLNESRADLLIVGTTGLALRHHNLMPELTEARRRGVRIRALLPLSDETMPKVQPFEEVMDVRARELEEGGQSSRVAILLADNAKAFLINFLPDDDNLYTGKDIGVYTDQEAMVAALGALVEPHWNAAPTLAARRDRAATGRAPDFTRVYTGRDEAMAALAAALSRGVRDLRVLDSRALARSADPGQALLAGPLAAGATVKSIVNVDDAQAGAGLATHGSLDVRHLAPRLSSRYVLLDDREAFFSLATGPHAPADADLVVHTSSASVVRSLARHFDQAWARAMPLAHRLRELEEYPHVQPRDLGLGLLFDETREGVAVVDEDGRIVLWNPAAAAILGYAASEAMRLEVGAVFPDAVAPFLDAITGARQDALPTLARRKDGARVDVALRLSPTALASTSQPFALCVFHESVPAGKRVGVATPAESARL